MVMVGFGGNATIGRTAPPGRDLSGPLAGTSVRSAPDHAADRREARRIIGVMPTVDNWGLDGPAARLDALVALADRGGVERESALFLEDESFYRPFALRALGLVRGELGLIEEARARFDAMGLEWQANQTRELIEPPPQAGS